MVERSYGVAENDLKGPENQEITDDPRWPPSPLRRPDPGACRPLKAVFLFIYLLLFLFYYFIIFLFRA